MNIGFYYNKIFLEHVNVHSPVHNESPERLKRILEYLAVSDISKELIYRFPERDDAFYIKKTHCSKYFDELYQKLGNEKDGFIDEDTFFSDKTLAASIIAANMGVHAAREILEGDFTRAFCCVRPPGHHAESKTAMGFCLFNNVAVTANFLRMKGFKRILIVDFDVHHGNGTQEIFYEDPEVMFVSIHQKDIYPHCGFKNQIGIGHGEGFTINIPLEAGATFADLRNELTDELKEYIYFWKPEAILFSAGFDAHKSDEIAQLNFESADYFPLTKWFLDLVENNQTPVISFLEGGYNLDVLPECLYHHLRALIK